jgi:hypothetical protein
MWVEEEEGVSENVMASAGRKETDILSTLSHIQN